MIAAALRDPLLRVTLVMNALHIEPPSEIAIDVQAQYELDNCSVQVLDYHWHEGFKVSYQPTSHVLNIRLFPYHVEMPTALGGERCFHPLGETMFFPADVQVETIRTKAAGRSHNFICGFTQEWVASHDCSIELKPSLFPKCLDIGNRYIRTYLNRLAAEVLNPTFTSRFLIKSLSEVLLLELLAHLAKPDDRFRVRVVDGKLSAAAVKSISELIEEDPTCNLDELARSISCSAGHLSRAFHNTTGITLYKYISMIRVKKAKQLLSRKMALKQVAFELGFSGVSAFSRAYFNVTGERPSKLAS